MNLRLPVSGSVLESLPNRPGASPTDMADSTTLENVTEAEVVQAVDEMPRGHIEYVILEDGAKFLQAAGEGAGPYALQYSPGADGAMIEVPGGVDADTMRKVPLGYARGDLGWRGALGWAQL